MLLTSWCFMSNCQCTKPVPNKIIYKFFWYKLKSEWNLRLKMPVGWASSLVLNLSASVGGKPHLRNMKQFVAAWVRILTHHRKWTLNTLDVFLFLYFQAGLNFIFVWRLTLNLFLQPLVDIFWWIHVKRDSDRFSSINFHCCYC